MVKLNFYGMLNNCKDFLFQCIFNFYISKYFGEQKAKKGNKAVIIIFFKFCFTILLDVSKITLKTAMC